VAVDVQLHLFLASALDGGEWSASRSGRFAPPGNISGSWVSLRAGLDGRFVEIHTDYPPLDVTCH
jgi:hypothetical protein